MKQQELNEKFIPSELNIKIIKVFYFGIERNNYYDSKDFQGKPVTRERIKIEEIESITPMEKGGKLSQMFVMIRHKHGCNYCEIKIS
jgi:hypothetical protein